ncbi:Translation initiation factor 1A [Coemansia sp. RSA 2336]|nr:Translation initiation factor 1A [Coemansia sp. RSA 2336]KAJ2456487.1 Translation initiation factor 1A [Coemansia sp. RSA 2336]
MDKKTGAQTGNVVVDAPKQLAKDAEWLLRRCTKPNQREYLKIVQAVVMGFLVMGFVGYFTKLIHIPINNIIGGKAFKKGKSNKAGPEKRELVFKDEEQEYAVVTKILGNGRMEVQCFDKENKKRLGHVRGALRKKVWIGLGEYILVSLREFQDDKCDILLKYSDEEVKNLRKAGQLPEKTSNLDNMEEDDDFVKFDKDEEVSDMDVDIDDL